jgi:spore photoproduct lyase
MTITDNRCLTEEIESLLSDKLPIRLGVNKKSELVRLIYEVLSIRGMKPAEVLDEAGIEELAKEGRGELFHRVKKSLLEMRYPSIHPEVDPHLMPVKIDGVREECPVWDFDISPRNIFVEKRAQAYQWTDEFIKKFPGADVTTVESIGKSLSSLAGDDPVSTYNSRRENIFLIENRSAFIKICPCTKGYKRCGYWILNVGFGCPVDCSYCYLQMYSNAPGIILPANVEDYFKHIEKFDSKVRARTRIGTGEFTDSLALDKYTGYSSKLIPFFSRTKKLVLELKTKVSDIENVLKEEPHDNIVISWSMNTRNMAERYEKGGASIDDRLDAALRASRRGYRIGFHFDPVVFYRGWEKEYKSIVEEMFAFEEIRKNTAWISLGTLRYTPGLKQVAENRFTDNQIFYEGEFFVDTDGKLRYPRPLRTYMYNKMISWIRTFDTSAWIYLCMEPEELWRKTILKKSDYGGGMI